jgi:hypothetical protein
VDEEAKRYEELDMCAETGQCPRCNHVLGLAVSGKEKCTSCDFVYCFSELWEMNRKEIKKIIGL